MSTMDRAPAYQAANDGVRRRDTSLFAGQLGALGERVRAARQSHAWSQQDLGNRTDIDRANLSLIEVGKKNVTLEVLWRLASTLQMHWADLLDIRISGLPKALHTSAPFEQQLQAFGTRVYQARVLQRLSQQALAERSGICPSTTSRKTPDRCTVRVMVTISVWSVLNAGMLAVCRLPSGSTTVRVPDNPAHTVTGRLPVFFAVESTYSLRAVFLVGAQDPLSVAVVVVDG